MSPRVDVLLVSGPRKTRGLGEEVGENLGLGYLAALLRERGIGVEILDASLNGWGVGRLAAEIKSRHFRVLGLSVLVPGMLRPTLATLAALGTHREYLTVLGGHIPTFSCRDILTHHPQLDVVVRGEGEETFLDLVERSLEGRPVDDCPGLALVREGEVVLTAPRPLVADLDRLPFPARDTLASSLRHGTTARLVSSRGCPGRCTFCSIRAFYAGSPGPPWRARTPENVAGEIEELVNRWGVKRVRFSDDNFVGPGERGRRRALELAGAIAGLGLDLEFTVSCRADDVEEELFARLKQAGLRQVFLGVESGVQRILDSLGKNTTVERNREALRILAKLGLEPGVGFIMFTPDTRLEDLTVNLQFLREMGVTWRTKGNMVDALNRLDVYAGTPLAERLRDEGRLRGDYRGYHYNMEPAVEVLYRTLKGCQDLAAWVRRLGRRAG